MTANDQSTDWHRISPVSVVFFLFRTVREVGFNSLPAIIVLFAFLASGGPGRKAMVAALIGLALVAAVGFSVLHWLRFRFRIAPDRVLVRSGVIQREELDIDFGRIQNVSIREPFYMRPFGLAILGIDTAGSSQKEIQLGGIEKRFALVLKETFLKAGRYESPGSAQEGEGTDSDSALLTRDARDIVIYGLTVNFLLWVLIALGLLFGGGENTEPMLNWLAERVQIEQLVASLEGIGPTGLSMLAVGAVFATLTLLSLLSVLGALYRYHGYRLTRQGETYTRRSGILTRHEESIKQHKIQAVVLKQNPVGRAFGRYNMQLRVASAGSASEGGPSPAGTRSAFVVPALRPAEAAAFCSEFSPGSDLEAAQFTRSDRVRLTRVITLGAAAIALPPALIPGLLVDARFFAILPLMVLAAWLLSRFYWRRSGFAVVGEHGFVRRGVFGTGTTVFPLFKIQRIDIRQTPGLRRRGLATLHIHLASHSLTVHYINLDDAKELRDLALYYAESCARPWY